MLIHRVLLVSLLAAITLMATADGVRAESNTLTTLSVFASDSALVLDAAGNPVIAYRDSLDTRLRVLRCDDPFCAGGGESFVAPDDDLPIPSGTYSSIQLDASDNPVVSYYSTPFDRLKLLRCDDPDCVGVESITFPDPQAYLLDSSTSLAIDAAGNPVIAYTPWSPLLELRIMHCNDPLCAGNDESITIHDSLAAAPSLTLDSLGNPVVAYYRAPTQVFTTGTLRVMRCNDPDCAGGDETTTSPEPAAGITPSLQLDSSGNPVIAYYTGTTTKDLKVMHCNDPACAGGNESIVTPDSVGDVGSQPSLALSGGKPVVTYRDEDNTDLKLLKCTDPDCLFGSSVSLDVAADSGENSSLAIDASGRPVVSYDAGADLRLIRCGDPDCAETVGGLTALAAPLAPSGSSRGLLQPLVAIALALATATGGLLGLRRLRSRRSAPARR